MRHPQSIQRLFCRGLLLPALVAVPVAAQTAAPQPPARDYAKEAYVFEVCRTTMRYEKDGTGHRDLMARVRIQSESGVEALGQLVFGYNSANERLDIRFVKVHKADGSVVEAGPEAVQDLSTAIERSAPEYTDYREKHVTVPGLRPGDTLEYSVSRVLTSPLAPGQFWDDYWFFAREICLDETCELDVPKDMALKLKRAPDYEPSITENGDRRIYHWAHAQLKDSEERQKEEKAQRANRSKKKKAWEGPDLSFSTFQGWDQLGRWYAGLEKDRRAATPAIKAKADQLTGGIGTDLGKVEAIYDFVAKNNRYVSLSFGTGRYQPHAAEQTLKNQYGDCKDKHTLLAALLQAEGYKVNSVLIHASQKLDPDFPSPSQFNHVITQVALKDGPLWMDATAELAPFRFLTERLRDKQALVIPQDGAPRLEETPLEPPFPCHERVEIEGEVGDDGAISAKVHADLVGDAALMFRDGLRSLPEAQWKEAFKLVISGTFHVRNLDDFDFHPQGLDDTRKPLILDMALKIPHFLMVKDRTATVGAPGKGIEIPAFKDEDPDKAPLLFGAETEWSRRSVITFPAGVDVHPPLGVSVKRDYGQYESSYTVEGRKLVIERKLSMAMREIPYARKDDWAAFRSTVIADQGQQVEVESARPIGVVAAEAQTDPDEAFQAAFEAHQAKEFAKAAELYRATLKLDPDHKFAWRNLGNCYMGLREFEKAAEAFQKAESQQPYDEWAYYYEGLADWRMRKYEDAIRLMKKQIEISPLHTQAHRILGQIYIDQRDWKSALPEMEKALAIDPKDAYDQVQAGRIFLNLNQEDKAMAAFDKAVAIESSPATWNEIAYLLSVQGIQLDRAQQYAESAVSATAAKLRNLKLDADPRSQQALTNSLSAYWDTLGWVQFQRGALDDAERRILPAWQLSMHGEVGDHLGEIAEKRGDARAAARYYAQALTSFRPDLETRGRLVKLLGGEKQADQAVKSAAGTLQAERVIQLDAKGPEDGAAECYISFLGGPVVEDIHFISGSEKLKGMADAIRRAKFDLAMGKDLDARVVLRAMLRAKKNGPATLTLFTSDASDGDSTSLR